MRKTVASWLIRVARKIDPVPEPGPMVNIEVRNAGVRAGEDFSLAAREMRRLNERAAWMTASPLR